MKIVSVEKVAEEIAQYAKISFDESWTGDYRKANNAFRKCAQIKKQIVEKTNIVDELTRYMLASDDIHMKCEGMLIALSTGKNVELAKIELRKELDYQNSTDDTLKKMGFEAAMLKKSIEENGFIKLYQDQTDFATYDKNWMV